MKNLIKIVTISFGISLILIQNACQKDEVIEQNISKSNVQQPKELFSKQNKQEGSLIRKKVDLAMKTGNFRKEAPFELNEESLITNSKAKENTVDRGCGKFKKITTTFLSAGYDEIATVFYKTNNLIDYIDIAYSDDPSYNGRIFFSYSENIGTNVSPITLEVYMKRTSGEVLPYRDRIDLNAKGYAIKWLHDFTNFRFDNPFTENLSYNADGYPTRFQTFYESKLVSDESVKYTKELNFESITDAVSGDVITYTNDLTKPAKIALSTSPFWPDYTEFYGKNSPNYWTKLEIKDKSNKLQRTVEVKREFATDGYISKATRIEDGEIVVVFKDITYDCNNYNVSKPRSYK